MEMMDQDTEATVATPCLVPLHLLAAVGAVMDLVGQAQAQQETERLAVLVAGLVAAMQVLAQEHRGREMTVERQTQTHQVVVVAVVLMLLARLHLRHQVVLVETELPPQFPAHR
jgi:hypothetical protein